MEKTLNRAKNVALAAQLTCCAATFIPGMPFPARLVLFAAALWLTGFHLIIAFEQTKAD